jgi:hypothetical protein
MANSVVQSQGLHAHSGRGKQVSKGLSLVSVEAHALQQFPLPSALKSAVVQTSPTQRAPETLTEPAEHIRVAAEHADEATPEQHLPVPSAAKSTSSTQAGESHQRRSCENGWGGRSDWPAAHSKLEELQS